MPAKKDTIEGAELINQVQRMELKPGDVIIARSQELMRPELRVYLEKQFNRLFPNNQTVILDGDLELFIMAEAQDPAEPAEA